MTDIHINASEHTPTELILETQRLHFRDPQINVAMATALRKIADGIENKTVGITRLHTSVDNNAHEFPRATFEFDFIDHEHERKSLAQRSDHGAAAITEADEEIAETDRLLKNN